MAPKYLILDTNIILLDANNISTLGASGSIIVIPSVCVNELDGKKSTLGELGYQARSFGRLIAKGTIKDTIRTGNLVITPITLNDGTEVQITSLTTYPDMSEVDEKAINDRKIIEVAIQYQLSQDPKTTFMTNDVMCRVTALALGVPSTDLKITEKINYEFVKELLVAEPEMFRTLHQSKITDVDSQYTFENCSYKFTCITTAQMKLATIHRGIINILGKDTEQTIRKQSCPPINSEQLLASKAILDPLVDLVIIEGLAGSGKNVVALSSAIRLLKTSKDKYDGIVYIRTPINDEQPGEDIGYMSGNEEKLALYLGPMEDTIDFLVRQTVKKKPTENAEDYSTRIEDAQQKLKTECGMESGITTGWRGRTLHKKIVIFDEWTNASLATSQKMLTRIGKDCKVLVIGSLNQIDSPYLSKYNNGMSILLKEVAERQISTNLNIFAINLHKVVRSDMALFAEELHK